MTCVQAVPIVATTLYMVEQFFYSQYLQLDRIPRSYHCNSCKQVISVVEVNCTGKLVT